MENGIVVFCGYEEDMEGFDCVVKRYESVEEYEKEWEDDFYRLVGIKYGILVGEEVVDEINENEFNLDCYDGEDMEEVKRVFKEFCDEMNKKKEEYKFVIILDEKLEYVCVKKELWEKFDVEVEKFKEKILKENSEDGYNDNDYKKVCDNWKK